MRTKDLENTRRKEKLILDAARSCFLSKGFHKTTMRDIAKEASISLGSIYQYYQGKNDIILKFVQLSNQETDEAMAYISEAKNFKKALKDVLFLLLDDFTKKKELVIYLEILSEAMKNQEVKEIVQQERTEQAFENVLLAAQKGKKIDLALPADIASHMLLSAVETAAANVLLHDKSYKLKNAKRYILQMIDLVIVK